MSDKKIERRLAAILAADVVGYSRLMGADEEGTLARLKDLRRSLIDPKITEHHGRIVKTTGDGLLVEFASVVDAVRCAVEMQNEMAARNEGVTQDAQINIRIGINVGDIIIDEGDIFGDGVNIAARLETLAEPGGICVSQIVHDSVRNKLAFGFEDMGDRNVKNIAAPVHAYAVRPDASAMAPRSANPPAAPVKPAAVKAGTRPPALMAALAFAAVSAAALGVLALTNRGAPAPQPAPAPAASSPAPRAAATAPAPQSAASAPGILPQADADRITQAARDRGYILQSLSIAALKPETPPDLRKFLGVWASDFGMNGGKGRYAMVIINSIEPSGLATGYLMFAPGAPGMPDTRPATTAQFSGTVTDQLLAASSQSLDFTLRPGAGNVMFLTMLLKDNLQSRNLLKPLWVFGG